MTHDSLVGSDWSAVVRKLGGARRLDREARDKGAFTRARAVKDPLILLRLALAYCLGRNGLRATAAWAEGTGLARLSNVALLGRLRNMAPWLEELVARLLASMHSRRPALQARPIRIVDATTVPKASRLGREGGGVWRVHAVFDLPQERFSSFEVTDEAEGERFDRAPVVAGEIRIGDRGYVNVAELHGVLARGADVVVRSGWRQVRWRDADGKDLDVLALFKASRSGRIDRAVMIAQGRAAPLALRLVAIRKPKAAAEADKARVLRIAERKQHEIMPGTLIAAEWLILLTSLDRAGYPADKVFELYRLRWRIEIAFKRLKSIIGMNGPPGEDAAVAKAHVLCHLLAILLTEPLVEAVGDSPRLAHAHAPTFGAPSASPSLH